MYGLTGGLEHTSRTKSNTQCGIISRLQKISPRSLVAFICTCRTHLFLSKYQGWNQALTPNSSVQNFLYLAFWVAVFLTYGRAQSPNQACLFDIIHGVQKQWSHSPEFPWTFEGATARYNNWTSLGYCSPVVSVSLSVWMSVSMISDSVSQSFFPILFSVF